MANEEKELVERLRDHAAHYSGGVYCPPMALLDKAASTIERLSAIERERDALREALKPFAAVAEDIAINHPGWDHDGFMLKVGSNPSTLGPYRRARHALNQTRTDASEATE